MERSRGPTDVSGFIIPIGVNPIQAVTFARPLSDIVKELFETRLRIRPFRTNFNTSSPILGISNVILYGTASEHGVPDMVLLRMESRQPSILTTAVRFRGVRVEEVVMSYRYWMGTTRALAKPHALLRLANGKEFKDCKLPKYVSLQVEHPT